MRAPRPKGEGQDGPRKISGLGTTHVHANLPLGFGHHRGPQANSSRRGSDSLPRFPAPLRAHRSTHLPQVRKLADHQFFQGPRSACKALEP